MNANTEDATALIHPVGSSTQALPPPAIAVPVDIRSVSLGVIATLAVIFALKWASLVLVPIALAAFLSYALRPLVVALKRHLRVPEPLGAAFALALTVGVVMTGAASLESQGTRLLDSVPRATKKLERVLHHTALDNTSPVKKLLAAAEGLERVSTSPRQSSPPSNAEAVNLRGYLWSGTEALVRGLFQVIVVLALSYFLLVSSPLFKRKLVRIAGSTLTQKKTMVQVLDEIDSQIQRYVVIQIGTSALVGAGTGVAFALIGLENATLWGVAAGVLHLIPYVGTAAVVVAAAMVAWLQFGSVEGVLLVVASATGIATIVGFGVVPWMTEKIGRINSVSALVSLMLWQWLWGIPGLLLGVPIMMALIAVCERVDRLQPIAELLCSDLPATD